MTADHLDATKRALLAHADANARTTRAATARRAQATVTQARTGAAELLAATIAAGEADARVAADRLRAAAQRVGRERLLGAETDAYQALLASVVDAVGGLAAEPGYPELEKTLVEYAHRRLGADAVISSAPRGGILARLGSRQLDLSLEGFGRRAVAAVLDEAERE